MFQHGHLVDQPQGERGEVISPSLGRRNNKDVFGGIKEQLVDHIGRTDPRLANTTEPLKDSPSRTVLHPVGNLVLDWCWIRKLQVFPAQVKEVSKVFELMWNLMHRCRYLLLFSDNPIKAFVSKRKKVYQFTKR